MLQIQHICKKYITGKLVQNALDDVSLNLRDNEFVAILGPSGSGKTTLLNIIGGLDRYDSGDLIINGISTEKYSDRDWDSYRNHTIGFVFQSYNLIPHQTILSNVELALTISGIGKSERRERAIEALKKVGLGEQLEKRPNQLSGGQMQRVAIARALVNDPDILLADEPTGALDSDTSIQVMDLLQEVAKNRLVVMVTHNPELAEEYATRIVRLRDGKIRADSNPYVPDEASLEPARYKNMGKSSMSILTSLALSFNNLRTKKARTLLTSFAGSIGIIGIALILALSNGVNAYIKSVEEDTLSEYPLQIQSTGFDLSSMISIEVGSTGSSDKKNSDKEEDSNKVNIIQAVTNMFSTFNSNDLKSLKTYFDSGKSDIEKYTNSIEYTYNIMPQIYRLDKNDSVHQVNPDNSFSSMGIGSSASSNSMMSSMMSTNVFYQMPAEDKLYKSQYDVKAGRWPKSYNECIMVLSSDGSISDFLLYTLGLRDSAELDKMVKQFMNEENVDAPSDLGSYTYDDILGTTFKLVNSSDYYEYDAQYKVWKDKTDDEEYMKSLVRKGEDLKIVGIVQPAEDARGVGLNMGINYPSSLVTHIVDQARTSRIVKDQLASRNVNVFTGEAFGTSKDKNDLGSDSLFSVNTDALQNAFQVDDSLLNGGGNMDFSSLDLGNAFQMDPGAFDLSGLMNLDHIDLSLPEMPGLTLGDLMKNIKLTATPEQVQQLASQLLTGFADYSSKNPDGDYSKLAENFAQYLRDENGGQSILRDTLKNILGAEELVTVDADMLQNLIQQIVSDYQENGSQNYSDFNAYLNSPETRAKLSEWAKENLKIDVSKININDQTLNDLATNLANGYLAYAAKPGNENLANPGKMGEYFMQYLNTEEAGKLLSDGISTMVDTQALQAQISTAISSYMGGAFSSYGTAISSALGSQINSAMQQVMNQLAGGMGAAMTQMMSGIGNSLSNMMNIDADAFANAFSMNMNGDELMELLMSMGASENASYDSNLLNLGYVDFDSPGGINIYPIDFESKEKVIQILDDYNERMTDEGKEEQVITYTDMVGALMSSVTNIIDIISYVLIAFVAISLVVSSIMIGVITYISVLERKKEIGILRAIGASKNNISQVFNAETGIIGLCAGLLGIGISLLLLIPGNALIHLLADNNKVNAILPPIPAIILILLSIVLTLIGGLIPSKKAAKSDPVTALRTD